MFAISVGDIPHIPNYETAKRLYDGTKPIRGSLDDVRPLGKRRDKHKLITKGTDERGEYYAAKLYRSELVKYYPNGTVLLTTDGWSSMSTAKFIDRVAPVGHAYLFDNKVWIVSAVNTIPLPASGLLFNTTDDGRLACIDLPKYHTLGYNKQETKRIRALPAVKALRNYLATMRKIGAWQDTGHKHWFNRMSYLEKILSNPTEEPDLELLAQFGDSTCGHLPLQGSEGIYAVAVRLGITTHSELYVEVPWVPGQSVKQKGVRISA